MSEWKKFRRRYDIELIRWDGSVETLEKIQKRLRDPDDVEMPSLFNSDKWLRIRTPVRGWVVVPIGEYVGVDEWGHAWVKPEWVMKMYEEVKDEDRNEI